MTIRRRLVLMTVAAFVVVLFVSGVAAQVLLRNRLIADLDAELGAIRSQIESVVSSISADTLVAMIETDAAGFGPAELAVMAVAPDGTVLGVVQSGTAESPDALPELSADDVAALRESPDPFMVGERKDSYRVTALELANGTLLVLGQPLDVFVNTMRGSLRILAGIGFLAAVVLATGVWWLIRRELDPLADMASTAERINEGDLSGRVAVSRPSNEVGRLGGALNAMLGRIEDALAAKAESEGRMRRFVADAAHELRTPLTSIRGYAELYRRGATTPEHVDRSFSRIEHEAGRMGDLVDDLVLLAKLDEERPFAREHVDMRAVAKDAVADARAIDPDRPLKLEVSADEATVEGDSGRLRQVVVNLLGNVRTHTEPGTPATVAIGRDGHNLVLVVADEGPGMDEVDADRAFERFYQAGEDRATPGSGLGLSIVRSIVTSHGGDVAIESSPGQGTVVNVRLPLAATRSL
ncbi:MAG: HAMP domain-containing histidine kinase [bacterium]|nr:HAMP domain-containing histidine kinase [bacterium]